MKATQKIIGAVLALAILAALSIFIFQSREPSYEGKSLSNWLQDWDNSFGSPGLAFPSDRVATAENAIRQMGSRSVPHLRKMLRTRDTAIRQKVVVFCLDRPWIPIHFRPPAYRLQVRGLFGIRTLGPTAKAAVPELVTLLHSGEWTVRAWAAGDLGKIGPEASAAVPDLVADLGDKDEHVRAAACGALVSIGASKAVMLPALMPCLSDTNDAVFSTALEAASRIGVEVSTVVPSLTGQLSQADPRVRYEAAMALGRYGEKARFAVPQLLKSLKDSDKDVREAAAGALIKIDPEAASRAAVPQRPLPAPDDSAVSGTLALQGPASIALDIYKSIAAVDLVMKFQGPIPGLINVRATRPLSQKESMEFLEKALLDQCGIVLEHLDEKHVAVKMKNKK
jgi:HEAT repeat protein